MEEEKIKIYENLLNEREEIDKECLHIHLEYMRIFGELLVKEYELQIETIKYKKMLLFCTKKKNYNEVINKTELDEYIKNVMFTYETRLNSLIFENKFAHTKSEKVLDGDLKRIKNIYRMIVHMTHPDLHPELKNKKEISKLWDQAVIAYKSNKLNDLILIYDKIILLIDKENESKIENIDEKIEFLKDEIDYIKSNEPYTYLRIIKDKDKINEIKTKLEKNMEAYLNYIEYMKNKLKAFNIIFEA